MVESDTKRDNNVQHMESTAEIVASQIISNQCADLQPTKKVHVVMTEHSDNESDDSLYHLEEVGAVNHSRQSSFSQYCRSRKQRVRQRYNVN